LRPVGFEDELEIRVLVLKKGAKSLTFGCEFSCGDDLVARGQMSSACCILETGRPMRAVEIPAALADRIAEAPQEERDQWKSPIRPL
jgi:acyl-CoA thioesterase FadM